MSDKLFWLLKDASMSVSAEMAGQNEPFPELVYGHLTTSLGDFLAAFTDHGLCWFEPDPHEDLAPKLLAKWRSAVATYCAKSVRIQFESFTAGSGSLHLRGTDFQIRVWRALLRTLPGETLTYGQLAAELGMAKGARAAGNAVGANHLAMFVPCHRIVPAAGGAGNYRWGRLLKRRLLELESRSGPYNEGAVRRRA